MLGRTHMKLLWWVSVVFFLFLFSQQWLTDNSKVLLCVRVFYCEKKNKDQFLKQFMFYSHTEETLILPF